MPEVFRFHQGSSVGIATGYGLEGPRIESRWGDEIFRTCSDRPWGPPSLLYNWYRVFPGSKERPRRDADPSPLLVPWSRKSSAISLLLLWAVRPVQSLSVCTRVHFTLPFTFRRHLPFWRRGRKTPLKYLQIFTIRHDIVFKKSFVIINIAQILHTGRNV